MRKLFFIWALLIPVSMILCAQSPTDIRKAASAASANSEYAEAIQYYQDYLKLTGNRSEVALVLAEAYYHRGFFAEAAEELFFLREQSQRIHPEILWWEARVLHAQYRFSAAAEQYKAYWKLASPDDRLQAERALIDCEQGQLLRTQGKRAFVQNMGSHINSSKNELAPIYHFAEGGEGLIYSSQDQKDTDRQNGEFSSYYVDNMSEKPHMLDGLSSGKGLVYTIDTSDNQLILFSGNRWPYGDIMSCKILAGTQRKSSTFPFESPAQGKYGDTDVFWTSEGCILFAAQMEDGEGGYDIYKSCKSPKGWTTPEPLRGQINSSWHERSPSLHPNGEILFFSSDRCGGVGGFDIYYSEWDGRSWGPPQNLGIGVNSLRDELFFRWGGDEYTAYFASDRPGTLGGFDLFQAYFKEPFTKSVKDDLISIHDDNDLEGPTPSNPNLKQPLFFADLDESISSDQQDYLRQVAAFLSEEPDTDIHLLCRSRYDGPKKYDLFFSLKKARQVAEELNAMGVASKRIHLTAAGAGNSTVASKEKKNYTYRVDLVFSDIDKYTGEQNTLSSSAFNNRLHQSDFFYLAADSLLSGLTYSVQVAAFERIFEGEVLESYQWPMVKTRLDKNVNHYTVGVFTTYREAKNLRKRLLASGYKGAFIVAKIDGIRKTRGQLHPLKHKFRDLTSYIYVD